MPSVYSPRWVEPEQPATRHCEVDGCGQPGLHKAPKSRYSSEQKDYHWFCVDHVRKYNESWNYFSGMSDAEMEEFWQESSTGHRPTWKREGKRTFTQEDLHESVRRSFADYLAGRDTQPGYRRIAPIDRESQKSLALLDLEWPVTEEDVKTRYKLLVKQYHPDINQQQDAEDLFKKITAAYQQLKKAMKALKDNT